MSSKTAAIAATIAGMAALGGEGLGLGGREIPDPTPMTPDEAKADQARQAATPRPRRSGGAARRNANHEALSWRPR